MNNKRGQGLSTSAIVLIVLAVIVLVILILGFTMGWSNLAPWLSPTNVDKVVTSCTTACSTGSTYDFCAMDRVLKFENSSGKYEVTGNCAYFGTTLPYNQTYGFANCPNLC